MFKSLFLIFLLSSCALTPYWEEEKHNFSCSDDKLMCLIIKNICYSDNVKQTRCSTTVDISCAPRQIDQNNIVWENKDEQVGNINVKIICQVGK